MRLWVPERAWSICLLSIKSSQSIPETLKLAQRKEPLLSVTLTLANVQLLLIVSREAFLFEVELCPLQCYQVLVFLRGVHRALP